MNVAEVERGLRVLTVFDGSPAKRGGIRAGDVITGVDGRSLEGKTSEQATALIKGPAGTRGDADRGDRQASPRATSRSRARASTCRSWRPRCAVGRHEGRARRLSGFTSGAHGEVREAVDRLLDEGRRRRRARPAQQRRRPAQRGGPDLQHLHPRRHDRLHEGPRAPAPRLRGDRQSRSTRRSRSSCSSTASRRRRPRSSPAR